MTKYWGFDETSGCQSGIVGTLGQKTRIGKDRRERKDSGDRIESRKDRREMGRLGRLGKGRIGG